MADLSHPVRTPRMDIVRSMLAERDNRTGRTPALTEAERRKAQDRRKLWQERLAQYVREPAGD